MHLKLQLQLTKSLFDACATNTQEGGAPDVLPCAFTLCLYLHICSPLTSMPTVGSTCLWVTCTAARWHTCATETRQGPACWALDTMVGQGGCLAWCVVGRMCALRLCCIYVWWCC